MAACPNCHSPVRNEAARCDRCGAGLATSLAGGEPLELMLDEAPKPPPKAPPPPHHPRAATPGVPAPAAPAGPVSASAPRPPAAAPTHATNAKASASIGLDIDVDAGSSGADSLPASLQGKSTGASASLRIGPGGELLLARPPPGAGARAGLDEDGLDPYEIRAFADFGDPPAAFYLTPIYALRVVQRTKELRAELAMRMETVKAIDERVDDAVIAFGERVRPIAAENPIYKRAVLPVEEAERLVSARDAGLAAEMRTYKATTSALDEKLSALEAKLHQIDQESAALEAELTRLEDGKKRAEAKAKRAEIDIRSAEQSMAAGGGDSGLKLHLAEKSRERDVQLAEAARIAPLAVEALRRLEGPRAARATTLREIDEIRRQRRQAEERLKRQTGTRSAGVDDARARVRTTLAEFGRLVLTDEKTFGGDFDASRRAIERMLHERHEKELGVRLVEKAIRSADGPTVKRGILVAAIGVVSLLLLIFALPIYRTIHPPEAPVLHPADE